MKRRIPNEGDKRTMMMVGDIPAETSTSPNAGGYKCRTCGKKFETFQALGGHQGRHRKVRAIDDDEGDICVLTLQIADPTCRMLHQCKMCTKRFETGQALGGHMRRHKLEKEELILMERGLLRRRLAVEEKVEGDLVVEDVKLRRRKAEEDERDKAKSELVLAAKEFRLAI